MVDWLRKVGLRKEKTLHEHDLSTIESPWDWFEFYGDSSDNAICNICWWSGESFGGSPHSESAVCPSCGSIARDRFLFYCFVRALPARSYKLLETSPRLGEDYRRAMRRWFDYRASDYDQRAHRADLAIDLQEIDLPDASFDVILTPHVLEHVPDTDAALTEIYRILSPGGHVFLQVPVQQGWTTPPPTPEYHGDQTPVFWRFGFDLTARMRRHGFDTRMLCNQGFYRQVAAQARHWPDPHPPEIEIESLMSAAPLDDLMVIADTQVTRRLVFHPGYMFLTWVGAKPPARLGESASRSASTASSATGGQD